MNDDEPDRLVLTVEETAKALRLGRISAYKAIQRGDIPSIRIGRRILVPRDRLMALLNERNDQRYT